MPNVVPLSPTQACCNPASCPPWVCSSALVVEGLVAHVQCGAHVEPLGLCLVTHHLLDGVRHAAVSLELLNSLDQVDHLQQQQQQLKQEDNGVRAYQQTTVFGLQYYESIQGLAVCITLCLVCAGMHDVCVRLRKGFNSIHARTEQPQLVMN